MDDATAAPQRPLPEGTVTVLFSDVEGSTDLRTREGDDVAQLVLRTHERLLRDQIEKHEGHEVVFMGDGFMVAFGSARRALECAIDIQRTFEQHNREGPSHEIRVRIGLNSGEVIRESGTLYGTAVNAAARISAKAVGGQILVSQVTKELTSGVRDVAFADRGMFALKGFPAQWRLYEVAWRDTTAGDATHDGESVGSQDRRGGLEETFARPEGSPIVGRAAERAAIARDLEEVAGGQLRVFAIEGEAGIGKTRLLETAMAASAARGFGSVMVGGDEELRGPFFLLRTLLGSGSIEALADEARARDALERARAVLWGRSEGESGLAPNEQMLRVYDVATVALRSIADARPLTILFDDLQWGDEDSLKLIRYLVRTSSLSRFFVMLAQRPDPGPGVGAGTMLTADLERMGLARRARLERLSRAETAELLENLLGMAVGPDCAAALHARGEGVPFFVVEFARAFREAGLMQEVGGRMQLSQAARSTVAPNVQILIERRLAHLPADARQILADAAIIGRRVQLSELAGVLADADGGERTSPAALAVSLEPAVTASLIAELPEGSSYDYAFTHDEIRGALVKGQPRARRRAIHSALARRLEAGVAQGGACPATLAFHFLEAGEEEPGVRYSIRTARDSLAAFAPEEALRAIDLARGAAQQPGDRATLLRLRDDALDALGRPEDRLTMLAEMAALASALGDEDLELETTLRRASAARQSGDTEHAAQLALEAGATAEERGDRRALLRASIELGQARLQRPMGESYSPSPTEADIEGAAEAFGSALALASELGEDATWAAIRREQGAIEMGRLRAIVFEMLEADPEMFADPSADPRGVPAIAEGFELARAMFNEAIAVYERLGDQRGLMTSLIALAYGNILQETRHGHAGRVEQIRRLRDNLSRLTSESERANGDLYMLFGIHVYARSHGPVDLALARGHEAHQAARALADRSMELFSAGGLALTYVMLGDVDQARAWLDKAGAAALATTDALPDRQLETWRGIVAGAGGDAAGMRTHLARALALATERGAPAGRCEVLALQASQSARLGADLKDDGLLEEAEAAGEEAVRMARALPTSDAWFEAEAQAALAQVALARGEQDTAAEHALEAIAELKRTRQYYTFLHLDMRLLIARCTAELEDPRCADFRMQLRGDIQRAASETTDDELRSRWLRAPLMREIGDLVGAADAVTVISSGAAVPAGLSDEDVEILRRVMSGETNAEIASSLGVEGASTSARIDRIFASLGASSRVQATAVAVREGIV